MRSALHNQLDAVHKRCMLLILMLATCGCTSGQGLTPLVRLDLHKFGYQFSTDGAVFDYTELRFLSEDKLAVSVNEVEHLESSMPLNRENQHTTVIVVDADTSRIITKGEVTVEEAVGAVQVISGERLAVWNLKGLQICSAKLRCDPPLAGPGPLSVSPRGTRIVFGGYGASPFRVLDAESFKQVTALDDPERIGPSVIPGDNALLISRGPSEFAIQQPGKEDKLVKFERGASFGQFSFLNDDTFAYLKPSSQEAIVADLDGRQLRRYKLRKDYRTSFLPTASGKRFGIYEYGFTFWNSVLNFLDFEETRPPNFQRVRVIDISAGTEVASFEWDPRQAPLRQLIEPRLSPSGRRLAIVEDGLLEILEVR